MRFEPERPRDTLQIIFRAPLGELSEDEREAALNGLLQVAQSLVARQQSEIHSFTYSEPILAIEDD